MKRKGVETELEPSVAAEMSRVLSACKSWRDRCGRAFRLVHRLERFQDRAVVTVGKFDRLECATLARTLGKKGEHRVSDFTVLDGTVSFSITRAPTGAEKIAAEKSVADELAAEFQQRESVVFQPPGAVRRPDEAQCREAAQTLLRWSRRQDVSARVLPSNYELSVHLGTRGVGPRACAALAERWPGSFIDLERGTLVAVVDRRTPDL